MLFMRTEALVFFALQGTNSLLDYLSENSLTTALFTSFYRPYLNLMLDISPKIARDYEDIRSGEETMPIASEIVEQVDSRIIMQAVETAVAATLGIFGVTFL